MRHLIIAFVTILALSASASGIVRTVGPGGDPPNYETIQAAVSDSDNGDIIELYSSGAPYMGEGNIGIHFFGKSITLRPHDLPPAMCIIDCGSEHRAFNFTYGGGANTKVERLFITNGYRDDGGGAAYCDGTSPTFTNCKFQYCDSETYGGAILCLNGSSPSFINCQFLNNSAWNSGGAIECGINSSLALESCEFTRNSAGTSSIPGYGGAIFSQNSTLQLSYCHFKYDSASADAGNSYGGGVYIDGGSMHSRHCLFEYNKATDGGGIECSGNCPAEFDTCYFDHNRAYRNGGGIKCMTTYPVEFDSCSFKNNHADEYGGGMYYDNGSTDSKLWRRCYFNANSASIGGGIYLDDHSPLGEINNCSFSGNTVTDRGGAIGFGYNSSSVIENSTFSGNVAAVEGGGIYSYYGRPHLSFCNFYGNSSSAGDGGGVAFDHTVSSHPPKINKCIFDSNTANQNGGGISSKNSARPEITYCTFDQNHATNGYGGGAFCSSAGVAKIHYCTLSDNDGIRGGGIAVNSSSPSIIGCVLNGNDGTNYGGGMYLENVSYLRLTSNTLYGNNCDNGAGIYCCSNVSILEAEKTIIASNKDGKAVECGGSSTVQFSCCDVYGNVGGDWVDCLAGQNGINGNFSLDPMFYEPTEDDFRLKADSPCAPGNHPNGDDCGLIGALDVHPESEPTSVALSSFTATGYDGYIEIEWATAAEIGNACFNVHRSTREDGGHVIINGEIIPAKGKATEGASYSFIDRDVTDDETYYYMLEDVDMHGNSIMHGPISVKAGSGGDSELQIPTAFTLGQNYPNPFNPVTDIMYNLPIDCHVRLEIYNILGEKVATLMDEYQKSGSKLISWDGRDTKGIELSSGAYFYKLEAGNFSKTRKMVLLR